MSESTVGKNYEQGYGSRWKDGVSPEKNYESSGREGKIRCGKTAETKCNNSGNVVI